MNGTVTWWETLPGKNRRPHWCVSCKPHVMVRLKRWIPRADTMQHNMVFLADTPDIARDLLILILRYPMDIAPDHRRHLESQAQVHIDRELLASKIISSEYTPKGATTMKEPPRDYQDVAADLAIATGQLLLADDLGLGKTISAITVLAKSGMLPALVVTLTHLPKQWQRELLRFTPDLTTHILEKAEPYPIDAVRRRRRALAANEVNGTMPDVIISNYHKLGGWAHTLAELPIKTVIFDECQELRSGSGTHKYEAAKHIADRAQLRLGLSATPIYNYGGEIYNVLNVIAPDVLGTQDEFLREWCNLGYGERKASLRDPKVFGEYVRDEGLMLRRTRADAQRELKPLNTFPIEVETDKRSMAKFGDEIAALARTILSTEQLERGAKFRASADLDYRLRRETGMAKASFTAQFVRSLVEAGESVVLYGWHHDVYEVWKNALADLKPAFFTGKESPAAKEQQITRFKEGETKVAILSLRAGAGLDGLQHVCRTVVFGELDWSPGVHEQAIGRVHRDGQVDPVMCYFLLADSGSDPIIADTLGVKRGQINGLRDPNAPLVEAATVDPNHMRKLAEEFLRQRGELKEAS